jgi:hypothetical protein
VLTVWVCALFSLVYLTLPMHGSVLKLRQGRTARWICTSTVFLGIASLDSQLALSLLSWMPIFLLTLAVPSLRSLSGFLGWAVLSTLLAELLLVMYPFVFLYRVPVTVWLLFGWGVTVECMSADIETRMAYLGLSFTVFRIFLPILHASIPPFALLVGFWCLFAGILMSTFVRCWLTLKLSSDSNRWV